MSNYKELVDIYNSKRKEFEDSQKALDDFKIVQAISKDEVDALMPLCKEIDDIQKELDLLIDKSNLKIKELENYYIGLENKYGINRFKLDNYFQKLVYSQTEIKE